MKDISKIIKIDMLSVYPYLTLKNLIIILVMGLFYPITNKNAYTMYGVTQVFAVLYCSYPFLVGDDSGIDTLYTAFAIDRKKVVYGRYIWSNLVILIFIFIGIILSGLVKILINEAINVKNLVYLVPIIFIVSNLIVAAQYPLYFKYGYRKSKIIMTSMFFVIAILVFIIVYFNDFLIKNMSFLFNNINLLVITSLLLFTILYVFSIIASVRAYNNRDFS